MNDLEDTTIKHPRCSQIILQKFCNRNMLKLKFTISNIQLFQQYKLFVFLINKTLNMNFINLQFNNYVATCALILYDYGNFFWLQFYYIKQVTPRLQA